MILCKSISNSNFPFLNIEYSIFKKGKFIYLFNRVLNLNIVKRILDEKIASNRI